MKISLPILKLLECPFWIFFKKNFQFLKDVFAFYFFKTIDKNKLYAALEEGCTGMGADLMNKKNIRMCAVACKKSLLQHWAYLQTGLQIK